MPTERCELKRLIRNARLARVEGECGFSIEIAEGNVSRLRLEVFEAPRFLEYLLRGRPCADVIDFTARVCGICAVAYQMTSAFAIEQILGISVPSPIRRLRRLMHLGEWISSHALHVYLLEGPDYFGADSWWSDRRYAEIAGRGLKFRSLGNDILALLGGRPVHPVSVKIGGFFRVPRRKELLGLLPELENAYDRALEGIAWASALLSPERNTAPLMECVSLSPSDEYPLNEGRVASSRGLDLSAERFLAELREYQVDYSTSLHTGIGRGPDVSAYLVGPVARVNLNRERLPYELLEAVKEAGINMPFRYPGAGIVARSIEIAYAFHEALRIIENYEEPESPSSEYDIRAGSATWATEAPRGLLIQHFELDESGLVRNARIIPPTAQNIAHLELTVRRFVQDHLDSSSEFLKREVERIIRSYDPCISCAVHAVVTGM